MSETETVEKLTKLLGVEVRRAESEHAAAQSREARAFYEGKIAGLMRAERIVRESEP